jgi:hypothetical protein
MLTGFFSNLSFKAYPLSPLCGTKPPLKQSATSFMAPSMKPLTHLVPSKPSNLFINYPGGTPPWTNQDGMPIGHIFTTTTILLNTTKSNSKEHVVLTSANARRLRGRAGSNLFLARTLKRMLLYSLKLSNIKSTPTP